MNKHQRKTHLIPSKQPQLDAVHGLSRFSGFYFIIGINLHLTSNNMPYWKILIQDSVETIAVYTDTIKHFVQRLNPFSPIQIECAKRRYRGGYYFVADYINPVDEIPMDIRNIAIVPYSAAIRTEDLPKLIDTIENLTFEPLKHFINRVLLQQQVMLPFLRNPASLRYHHNSQGGLLSHSLAVANLISQAFEHDKIEYDIAITAALLHDIGKTQTLTDTFNRTSIGSMAGHDALTLEICALPLALLSKQHPHVVNQLRHAWTSGSPNARYGFKPKTRVATELQRADRQNAKVF